jgi:geranylgeranyl diphosphate synthase type I
VGAGFLPHVQEVEAALLDCLDQCSNAQGLYDMIRYHLGLAGAQRASARRGKRMRALLSVFVGTAVGVDRSVLEPLTAAAEMMHGASLVHDDIQDADVLRWGRETVWKRYGVAHAINVGDAMMALTYKLLADLSKQGVDSARVLEVVRVFIESHLQMTEGQHLDLAADQEEEASLEQYCAMAGLKTGAACSCVCRSAAILGSAGQPTVSAYARYGWSLGVFYQACDDIASVWSAEERTGKKPLQDALMEKRSLPVLLAKERDDWRSLALLAQLRDEAPEGRAAELQKSVCRSLKDSGVYDHCLAQARRFRDEAAGALQDTGARGPARDALVAILGACGATVGIGMERSTTPGWATA